ncbi:MAG: hypothetical protein IKC11_02205 [Clostridia bacterium]|nr:hypothetical protein [Clostridia bacterium]
MDYNAYERHKNVTYRINNLDDIKEILEKDVKRGSGELYLVLETKPEIYNKALINDITKITEKFLNLGYTPRVSFNVQELKINDEELEEIVNFGAYLQRKGGDIAFNEALGEEYSVEEIIDAQSSIQKFLEVVKQTNASPFERFIMVQNYVTSRVYKEDEENPENSRDIVKVLNGQEIVCVGYAAIMEHFLNELGIKCLSQPCFVCDKNGESLGSHINNIVYLEDSKYNIKGWYYLDACWDSINKGEEPFLKYAYSLIPVGDVSQMKTRDIKMNGGFFGALYSKEEQKELYNELVESSVMSGAIAYEMGLEDEFDGLYEYLDGDDAEIIERREKACDRLVGILKENNIPADFFFADDIPFESSLPMFLANLMNNEVDEELLQTGILGFKQYKKFKSDGTLEQLEYKKAERFTEDVYLFIERFKNGTLDVRKENEIFSVEECLQNLRFARFVDNVIEEAKRTKPIPLKTYQKAIENTHIAQGADGKFAKVQAKRAIDKTVRLAELIYKESAKNCFRQEALRRREENAK